MLEGRDLWWHDLMALPIADWRCATEPLDSEDPLLLGIQFRRHFADSEAGCSTIRHRSADFEFQIQRIEVRFPHLGRPPKPGAGKFQLCKFVRLKKQFEPGLAV
jgi:hypothetical protein